MKLVLAACSVSATLAATSAAVAHDVQTDAESASFGDAGHVALGGYGTVTRNSQSQEGTSVTATAVQLSPLVDVFVLRGLSLGTGVTFAYGRFESTNGPTTERARSILLRPVVRLGCYVPIGDRVGFWPVVQAGYGYAGTRSDAAGSLASADQRSTAIGIDAQLLFHLTRGWFLRAVPAAGYVSSNSGGGALGATGLLGGFLVGFGGLV